MKPWLQYALIRVGIFAVLFAALYLLNPELWWAWAIGAALISLCIGYIFFGKLRGRIAADIVARRSDTAPSDDEVAEDG